MRVITLPQARNLANQISMAGIQLPANACLEFSLSKIEYHQLVEEVGMTHKIQKSMLRAEAMEMQINSVKIKFKCNE